MIGAGVRGGGALGGVAGMSVARTWSPALTHAPEAQKDDTGTCPPPFVSLHPGLTS